MNNGKTLCEVFTAEQQRKRNPVRFWQRQAAGWYYARGYNGRVLGSVARYPRWEGVSTTLAWWAQVGDADDFGPFKTSALAKTAVEQSLRAAEESLNGPQ